MAEPYIGEIRMFAGNFAPSGWMLCNGDLVSISEYETLFNLIGTTYGGDGESTFALPNLQGRLPIHMGDGFVLGEKGGDPITILTTAQIPAHSHAVMATSNGATLAAPANNVTGQAAAKIYRAGNPSVSLSAAAVGNTGNSGVRSGHDNMQPYLGLNFIISVSGIYPSPS